MIGSIGLAYRHTVFSRYIDEPNAVTVCNKPLVKGCEANAIPVHMYSKLDQKLVISKVR